MATVIDNEQRIAQLEAQVAQLQALLAPQAAGDQQIEELPNLPFGEVADDDLLVIADVSDTTDDPGGTTKNVKMDAIADYMPGGEAAGPENAVQVNVGGEFSGSDAMLFDGIDTLTMGSATTARITGKGGTDGADVHVYGGDGTGTDGNVILGHDGAGAVGQTVVGTNAPAGSSILTVSGLPGSSDAAMTVRTLSNFSGARGFKVEYTTPATGNLNAYEVEGNTTARFSGTVYNTGTGRSQLNLAARFNDSQTVYTNYGAYEWSTGLDHSTGQYVISKGGSLGFNNRFSIDNATGSTIVNADAGIDAAMPVLDVQVDGVSRFQVRDGQVIASNLPVADPAISGALWNDAGTVKISAG